MLWPFLSPQLTATDPFATWCKCLYKYAWSTQETRRTERDWSQAHMMFPSSKVSDIKASGQCFCPQACPIEHFYTVLGIRACCNCVRLLIFARAEADQIRVTPQAPWSREKRIKKSVFDSPFILIAAMLRCNQGALSQPFLYTSIFHAQLCLEPWAASWNRDLGHGGCYNTI